MSNLNNDRNLPYILNPVNINIYLKQMGNEEYLNYFKIKGIFQDVIKSIINNSNKSDQINTLNDNLNMIIKGENIYLKSFSYISLNLINRYYFINGLKKNFKDKTIKELSGNDFIQFCLLLSNDFNRNILDDILILYNFNNGILNNNFEKYVLKDTLINCTYNYKNILDVFSNYFLFYDLIIEINDIFKINETDDTYDDISVENFVNKLINKIEKKEIHNYYTHLIYKSILLISNQQTDLKNKFLIMKLEFFNEFKDFKINYYQLIWNLIIKINETKNLYEEIERCFKRKIENFNNFVDCLVNDQSEGDED